jgi:type I restriction enzyme S subunit
METKTIRELCDIVVDCPHSTPKWTTSGKIVIRNNNIKKGRIDFSSPSYTDDEHFNLRVKRAIPRSGDIIITREAPMGEVGMIPERIECCLGQRMVLLRTNPDICDNYYLLYSLQSKFVQHQISWSEGTGTTVSNLRIPHLEQLKIPYVPLKKQRLVASVLKSIEEKIILNEQINNNLLQQASSIFKAWFIDPDISEHEDWQMVTLEDITSLVTRGIAPKYSDESDQIVINQKCIRDHMLDLSPARKHLPKKINEKWLKKGDLLINSTGQGTLGRAAQIWFDPVNMTVDSHVTIVRPKNEKLIYYIGIWGILHEREIESLHTGSTGQTELPRDRVKGLELLLPDENALDQFNSVVKPITEFIISNQNENIRLADLRDSLLPKLMSGEIDVSDINF